MKLVLPPSNYRTKKINYVDELDGDGIGGAVLEVLTENAFRLLVSHTEKTTKEIMEKLKKSSWVNQR